MEKFRITVENAHGGSYQVKFINPLYDPNNRRSIQVWTTDSIADNASAWTVNVAIRRYFWSIWGANIAVTETSYDANDIETTSSSEKVKTVYEVSLKR